VRTPHEPPTNGHRPKRLDKDRKPSEVPPHDIELERHFLGSAFKYPEILLESGLAVGDFYSGAHGMIFDGMLHLAADGTELDTESLRGWLDDQGRLRAVGGGDYLLALTDTVPLKKHDYTRLRRLARQRGVKDAAVRVAHADADELEAALAAFECAKLELIAVNTPGSRAPSLADCIPAIAMVGPRLPIGLSTLDEATRGGIPMGRFCSVLGAPGASKTNLATWLGDRWERAGCAVLIVAADESRESIVVRLGQLDGFDRDLLEGLDPGRRNAFARNSRGRALKVVDPFTDRIMLEQCEAELLELAAGRPRVLIVDSLQRVPSSGAAVFEQKREQLEYVVDLLDGIAKRGTLVIAISEMSRAGYRTGKRDLDISALAAGAETRAIEYASHLIIGLKPVRGERGIIDLEVAKNRLGPDKPEIRLSLDFVGLGFREIERPDEEGADEERQKACKVRTRVLAAVARGGCKTTAAIARAAGLRQRDGAVMCRELLEEQAIEKVAGVYRVTALDGGAV
jgi:replicative DNA helicase